MSQLSPAVLDLLARAIHDRYRANHAGHRPTDPAVRDWSDLDGALKASNRGQAADILPKLRSIGCEVVLSDGSLSDGSRWTFAFTLDEIERLAEREHLRWVADRQAGGWIMGPVRDPERRITPYLVSYRDLPEEIRELDRDAVRAIPSLLREVGLAIRRLVPT